MNTPRIKLLAVPVVALALGVALALPALPGVAAAEPLSQRGGPPPGGGGPPPGQIGPPNQAETPELGSLVLFGGGVVVLGGFALARARRRLPSSLPSSLPSTR
jgi:hypothetical protein